MVGNAKDPQRKQYLVPRRSVAKLQKMSRQRRVSASELVRRAIEAYTSGEPCAAEQEAAARGVLRELHKEMRATLKRIDRGLEKLSARERALADGTLQDQVRQETQSWITSHPREMAAIVRLFAPEVA